MQCESQRLSEWTIDDTKSATRENPGKKEMTASKDVKWRVGKGIGDGVWLRYMISDV